MHSLHVHELFKTQFQWGIYLSFVSCLDYLELNRITARVIQIILENFEHYTFERHLWKKNAFEKHYAKFSLCAIKQLFSPFLPPFAESKRLTEVHITTFNWSNTLNTCKKSRLTIDSPQTTGLIISRQTVTSRELLKNFTHYAGIMLDALTKIISV